jgi:hypothetical protein
MLVSALAMCISFSEKEGSLVELSNEANYGYAAFLRRKAANAAKAAATAANAPISPMNASIISPTTAPTKGIAIVLRGEGFRDWQLGNNGFNLIKTCGCADAYNAQKAIYESHMQLKQWLENQGHSPVHFYGSIYPCSNGKSWAKEIPEWYGGNALKRFQTLQYSNETQWTTWSKSLALIDNPDRYWRVVVLRWDFKISHTIASCLLEAPVPMDAMDIEENGNYDVFDIFPPSFLPDLLTTVTDDKSAGGIGRVKCHPGKVCCGHSPLCEAWKSFQYEEEKCPRQSRQHFAIKHTAEEQNRESKQPLEEGGDCSDMCLRMCRRSPPFDKNDFSRYMNKHKLQCTSVWDKERNDTGNECNACEEWPAVLGKSELCARKQQSVARTAFP